MMLSYSYQAKTIRNFASDLNFGIASMPQIDGAADKGEKVNFANYFGEVISNKSKHQTEAWEFLKYLSSREEATKFLEKSGLPTARRDIVNDQINNTSLGVFAEQVLTAKSFYKPDGLSVDNIFADMIKSVNLGNSNPDTAIKTGLQQVNTLF